MSLPDPAANATVVVTGASSGIGADIARELAARGHATTLVARRRDRLDELASELRSEHGTAVEVLPADLAQPAGREEVVGTLRRSGRTLAGLVNNAGYGSVGRLWELEEADEVDQVALNVVALHELTVALLPSMVQRGSGAVLNVGSIAGSQPIPGQATYSATKAFVNSFSEALHAELRGTGVSCTVLTPGPVETEFAERAGIGELNGKGPGFVWVDCREVARQAVDGMRAGKRVVVPGLVVKALSAGGRFSPRTVLLPAVAAATARGPSTSR